MILVTGAKGVVGAPLCERLERDRVEFKAVSRTAGQTILHWDLEKMPNADQLAQMKGIKALIHTAPIWLLPPHIALLAGTPLKRIVVFSSTSVLSKKASPDPREQALVESLKNAEQALMTQCAQYDMALTILRPSLIYGYGRDQNVSHIARFIRRWRFMLLVGQASGKRQPVHADDLVSACLAVLGNSNTIGQAYNLAGKDVLTYRQMVEAIFHGLKMQPRVIKLPLAPFRWALSLAARVGNFAYTAEMANRMNQDMSYDIVAAKVDFGFKPQGFLENPSRDLGAVL